MESDANQHSKFRRQKFTNEEDQKLLQLVSIFGTHSWKRIAQHMLTRSTRQCRERYLNYLSPELKNGPWTHSEDHILLTKVRQFGPCWSKISKFFPTRSDVNIKNRYSLLVSKGKAPALKKNRSWGKKKQEPKPESIEPVKQYVDVANPIPQQTNSLLLDQFFPPDLFDSSWESETKWL